MIRLSVCIAFLTIFTVTMAFADIIIDRETIKALKRTRQQSVEIIVEKLPKNIELLCLDPAGTVCATTGKTTINGIINTATDKHRKMIIKKPCIIYGADVTMLSRPFSWTNDRDKLFILRAIKIEELQKVPSNPEGKNEWHCSLVKHNSPKYFLSCDETSKDYQLKQRPMLNIFRLPKK